MPFACCFEMLNQLTVVCQHESISKHSVSDLDSPLFQMYACPLLVKHSQQVLQA